MGKNRNDQKAGKSTPVNGGIILKFKIMKSNKFLYLTVNEIPLKPDFFICGEDIRHIWLMVVIHTPKLASVYDEIQASDAKFGRRNKEGIRYVSEIDFAKLQVVATARAKEREDIRMYDELIATINAITTAKTKLDNLREFITKQFTFWTGQTPPQPPTKSKVRKRRKLVGNESTDGTMYDDVISDNIEDNDEGAVVHDEVFY